MFKFTIRELLLLTLVVGLAVGWWLDHRRLEESAELANRFSQCTVHLAKMLERYGWHMTVFTDGLLCGDYCDPASPTTDVSLLPDDDGSVLWASDATWKFTREVRRWESETPSPRSSSP